jgi:serine/threonine protein kinase
MNEIYVTSFCCTGLHLTYEEVSVIKIPNNYFDSGSFGEIYMCKGIDGGEPELEQIVKILRNEDAARGHRVIQELQARITQVIKGESAGAKALRRFVKEMPGLYCLPQISFEGQLDGEHVLGYTCNFLRRPGYQHYENLFGEDKREARKQYAETFTTHASRMKLAFALAEAAYFLEQIGYVHGDINPQNIFMDMGNEALVLMDFDSGAFDDEVPVTPGKHGAWLAPELKSQQQVHLIDVHADRWSVGVLVHYLLFMRAPLFFLAKEGERQIKDYLRHFRWPDVNDRHRTLFNPNNLKGHHQYVQDLEALPRRVREMFSRLIDKGSLTRTLRPAAREWMELLGPYCHKQPVIHSFKSDRLERTDERPVILSWKVSGAYRVYISSGIGPVRAAGAIEADPLQSLTYQLEATDFTGKVCVTASLNIAVLPAQPVIHFFHADHYSLEVPGEVKLTWRASHFHHVSIAPACKHFDAQACTATVQAYDTTTYALTATSYFGESATAFLTISVKATAVTYFTSTLCTLFRGMSTRLVWKVEGVREVFIDQGIGAVRAMGEAVVSPTQDTTYTLNVKDYRNQEIQRQVTVHVLDYPTSQLIKEPSIQAPDVLFGQEIPLWKDVSSIIPKVSSVIPNR